MKDLKHTCRGLLKANTDSLKVRITKTDNSGWKLFAYDGDGVSVPVTFCPYCGANLFNLHERSAAYHIANVLAHFNFGDFLDPVELHGDICPKMDYNKFLDGIKALTDAGYFGIRWRYFCNKCHKYFDYGDSDILLNNVSCCRCGNEGVTSEGAIMRLKVLKPLKEYIRSVAK